MSLQEGSIPRSLDEQRREFARRRFLLPGLRFVAIPVVIIVLYAVTIAVLERRWRALRS